MKYTPLVLAFLLAGCSDTPRPQPPTSTPVRAVQPTQPQASQPAARVEPGVETARTLLDGDVTLAVDKIFSGVDGLDALMRGSKALSPDLRHEAQVLSVFAVEYKSYIDSASGLQYFVVSSWAVNFYSRRSKRQISLLVTSDRVGEASIHPTSEWDQFGNGAFPKLGNQKALSIANQKGLLRSNLGANAALVGTAEVPTLRSRLIRGVWRSVWELPYGGSELPVWIDAVSGENIGKERFP